MKDAGERESANTAPPEPREGEARMVRKQLWEELRRKREKEGATISGLARLYELDRKTVSRQLRQEQWEPYRLRVHGERILGEHELDLGDEGVVHFRRSHRRTRP